MVEHAHPEGFDTTFLRFLFRKRLDDGAVGDEIGEPRAEGRLIRALGKMKAEDRLESQSVADVPHNVIVIYHCWPHYRQAVARALCLCQRNRYTLASDVVTRPKSIKGISPCLSNIKVEDGGLRWRFLKNIWIGPFLWQRGVIRLALSKQHDTLIFLGVAYYLSTWVAAILARLRGKRVLMWTHGFTRRDTGVKLRLRNAFYRLANVICLYGIWARDFMLSQGFDPDRLFVIYNSLDYEEQKRNRDGISLKALRETRQATFPGSDAPVVVFVGRVTPQKRLSMLIEAIGLLRREGHEVNLLMIGTGDVDILGALVDQLGLRSHVKFFGPCYEERELAPLLMMSHVCVAPGEVGLTAMHSLAYGTPVVTHGDVTKQMPESEAIQPGVNGDFFEYGNVTDLASKIKRWASNQIPMGPMPSCWEVIEMKYNADKQVEAINDAVHAAWHPQGRDSAALAER